MAGCKPKKYAKGGMANSPRRSEIALTPTGPKTGPVTGVTQTSPLPRRSEIALTPTGPKTGPVTGVTQTSLLPRRSEVALTPTGPKAGSVTGVTQTSPPPRRSEVALTPTGPKTGPVTGLTQTQLSAAAKALQGFNAQRMGQGMGSQSAVLTQAGQSGLGSINPAAAQKLGTFGAGALGSMGRAFKKGGMVNAKKKAPASAGKSSSVKPRGSSGKGVKACKVC